MPRDFMLQMEIGPLYEPWTFIPSEVERQFEKDKEGRFRSGWSIFDPIVGGEIRNPFRVKMERTDTLFFLVVSRDWDLRVVSADVQFTPRDEPGSPPPPGTPFDTKDNPWGALEKPTRFPYPPDKTGWAWPNSEREEIRVREGTWDISATVRVKHSVGKGHTDFGFDPRMCVGSRC